MSNFVTVRQAFERAYKVNDVIHCKLGVYEAGIHGWLTAPVIVVEVHETINEFGETDCHWDDFILIEGAWKSIWKADATTCQTPDISDRPASAFVGFFDEAYDNAVKELEAGE